jgi:hypothetical protein
MPLPYRTGSRPVDGVKICWRAFLSSFTRGAADLCRILCDHRFHNLFSCIRIVAAQARHSGVRRLFHGAQRTGLYLSKMTVASGKGVNCDTP